MHNLQESSGLRTVQIGANDGEKHGLVTPCSNRENPQKYGFVSSG